MRLMVWTRCWTVLPGKHLTEGSSHVVAFGPHWPQKLQAQHRCMLRKAIETSSRFQWRHSRPCLARKFVLLASAGDHQTNEAWVAPSAHMLEDNVAVDSLL